MPLRILGSRVDAVTLSHALDLVRRYLSAREPRHVITGNTLMYLEAEHDGELRRVLEEAALIIPESWGIHWASRVQGAPLGGFIPGIDFMLALCRQASEEGRRVFLLGSAPSVAEAAGRALVQSFPKLQLAGAFHGYFKASEEADVLARIKKAAPDLLFVGMGMPAQEKWIAKNLQALGVPVVMGVGGSFDVLSGRVGRAPVWMRRTGVEWLYRLVREPWRWRRIAQLPVFAWKVWRENWNRSI